MSRETELHERLKVVLEQARAQGLAPSFVVAVAHRGEALTPVSTGWAVRYAADEDPERYRELNDDESVQTSAQTLYDFASVTKIFTALTILSLVDAQLLGLETPVAHVLPAYRDDAKSTVTVRHLLTHTSGLPGTWDGWRRSSAAAEIGTTTQPNFNRTELLDDLLHTPLTAKPGTRFEYSCTGFNTLMALAEQLTGTPWAALVQSRVLDKLAVPPGELTGTPTISGCAATEFVPELGRGMVRGTVHDEAAWALSTGTGSTLCGNAGMFGTVRGLLAVGEELRLGCPRILSADLADQMWEPQVSAAALAAGGVDFGHGLGLRIGQTSWVGDHPEARGHNGFTGTSVFADREAELTVAFLSNRVHPLRSLGDVTPTRRLVAEAAYASLAPAASRRSTDQLGREQ